jgi:hypothetical protein
MGGRDHTSPAGDGSAAASHLLDAELRQDTQAVSDEVPEVLVAGDQRDVMSTRHRLR